MAKKRGLMIILSVLIALSLTCGVFAEEITGSSQVSFSTEVVEKSPLLSSNAILLIVVVVLLAIVLSLFLKKKPKKISKKKKM
jgi:Na+/melibiose symporter-like transporter